MKLLDCIYIFLLSHLCQAEQNFTETDPNVRTKEGIINEPYLQKLTKCSFTLKMLKSSGHELVALAEDSAVVLLEEICSELECGGLFNVSKSRPSDGTCFHGCVYQDGLLQNCSLSLNNCTLISGVVCGDQAMRLAGGSDRCAGRVELWRNGQWGTVCDDFWGLRDADVACGQLGCGYALAVTGQGGPFPPGRGPIYLDDLNCTGNEDNLWSCPATEDELDCGHKEDAGVTCSEMRAVRLTGGLDRCSGRVEIHRNGSWGTVCDHCWNEHLASMVCTMLQCGTQAERFSQFVPPLLHNGGTQWYYSCSPNAWNLWECMEFSDRPLFCQGSKASGVVCNGSLGFPTANAGHSTVTTSMTTEGRATTIPAENGSILSSLSSPVLLGTIALSLLLLVFLITNTVLCCHYRRRYVSLLQRSCSRQGPPDCYSSCKDTVNLTKVTINGLQNDVSNQPSRWTQLDDDDDDDDDDYTPGDPDYEPSQEQSAFLSTFRNSQKYQIVQNPVMRHPDADRGCADNLSDMNEVREITPYSDEGVLHYARVSKVSADSFDSSSTSSGECYENASSHDLVAPDVMKPGPAQSSGIGDHLKPCSSAQAQSSGDEDDGPLYSPVSLEEPSLSDDDYDDVGS